SVDPAETQLDLAGHQRRGVLPEPRVVDVRRLRIRNRRAAEELAGLHRLHIEVLEVRHVERLGDRLEVAHRSNRERLRQPQRKLPELRSMLGVPAYARGTIGVLAVAVVVVAETVRPRLA